MGKSTRNGGWILIYHGKNPWKNHGFLKIAVKNPRVF
jgi:hypothetical protein